MQFDIDVPFAGGGVTMEDLLVNAIGIDPRGFFQGGNGAVEVEGMRWRAKWATDHTSKPGQRVRITQADAMVLHVENPA